MRSKSCVKVCVVRRQLPQRSHQINAHNPHPSSMLPHVLRPQLGIEINRSISQRCLSYAISSASDVVASSDRSQIRQAVQ